LLKQNNKQVKFFGIENIWEIQAIIFIFLNETTATNTHYSA